MQKVLREVSVTDAHARICFYSFKNIENIINDNDFVILNRATVCYRVLPLVFLMGIQFHARKEENK